MTNRSYYQEQINKALAYIYAHLNEPLSVRQLAVQSNFSQFHFIRIFKSLMDESPYDTILRLRLEKSVFMLKYHKQKSISSIAFDCGFPSPENFSRQFRQRYKLSPSGFRKDKTLHNSKIYQERHDNDFYLSYERSRQTPDKEFDVVIESLPQMPIAFVRAIFGADGSGLVAKYEELMDWVKKNAIPFQGEKRRFGMSIDNIEVTPASKYRYDFAIHAAHKYPLEKGIEQGVIPEAQYATVHCKGDIQDVAKAWDHLYKHWLPASEYIPMDAPALEEFVQGPEEIGWTNFNIKCRIPIIKY